MAKRILTVVGARPQFVKAAMLTRAVTCSGGIEEVVVHTGQHFDTNMSDVFFSDLDMAAPRYHLGIGGGSHGQNTGRMLQAVEEVLLAEKPDCVVVYGDTDSTLAGALAAVKLDIPVAHVEAGLRSFNRRMPEEINRVLTDHAADLLFAPTAIAVQNLRAEGIQGDNVRRVGDIMFDAALHFGARAERCSRVLKASGVEPKGYVLLTVHRPSNTDDRERLESILQRLAAAAHAVVWPLHPRTRRRIVEFGLQVPHNVTVIDPVGYLDMVMLEKHAALIATDSGGVQKEAYFHSVPCVTLRDETEWVELVEVGANRLAGRDLEMFAEALRIIPEFPTVAAHDRLYGEGRAAELILAALQ
jgi:UDP-GlcNAc3NAcA epimerase